MVDMESVTAAATGLKTAFDILRGLHELKLSSEVQAKVMELQGVILSAQQDAMAAQTAQSEMLRQVRGLEEEIARLKAWDAEKQRYELQAVREGVLAYALKEGVEPPAPPHHLCANCYDDGKKSVLQTEHLDVGRVQMMVCNRCGAEIITHGHRPTGTSRAGTWGKNPSRRR